MKSLYNFYYELSRLWWSFSIKYVGKGTNLRLDGRVLNGQYVKIGENCNFSKDWLFAVYPEFGGRDNPVKTNGKGIVIGNNVSANKHFTIYCAGAVTIEDNVMFGSNILVTDNDHGSDPEAGEYYEQPLNIKESLIEQGCWIGEGCCILAGSHIGKKCIIAANSVVKGEIPSYSMAAGSPAKVVRVWDFDKHEWRKI